MGNGAITIRRMTSNRDHDYIEIDVYDNVSRTTFFSVTMSLEDFALAITGRAHSPCEFELIGDDRVNKVIRRKTVSVPVYMRYPSTLDIMVEASRFYHTDGYEWELDMNLSSHVHASQFWNGEFTMYEVPFKRWE